LPPLRFLNGVHEHLFGKVGRYDRESAFVGTVVFECEVARSGANVQDWASLGGHKAHHGTPPGPIDIQAQRVV
jgi:hypothetical protein